MTFEELTSGWDSEREEQNSDKVDEHAEKSRWALCEGKVPIKP